MEKYFNTTGACSPRLHYMVKLDKRLLQIREQYVDRGSYFVINRARQYGKTTTLHALEDFLKDSYVVVSLDFQKLGNADFMAEDVFCEAFADYFLDTVMSDKEGLAALDITTMDAFKTARQQGELSSLRKLFVQIKAMCASAKKPIVLMIDEVDSATGNQVFLDFLAQLRGYYLSREKIPAFHSVILAGVYDIKNLKMKIRPEDEHKTNSPWNIAADFDLEMCLSADEIQDMLQDYEADHHTGMDLSVISKLIYDYTAGYPFLVSRHCQLMDKSHAWTKEGFLEANGRILMEKNTLFDSLFDKLERYPKLGDLLYGILFKGVSIPYMIDNEECQIGEMFGFLKNNHGVMEIANRTFETRLYNYFIAKEQLSYAFFETADRERNQFIKNGQLDMTLVMEKFVEHYSEIYGDKDERFVEEYGRNFFLLYLKPIINGTGHYYIEAQTRDAKRTDVIIDYRGEQFIVELKIWHGNEYNERGEKQLADYLEYYHLDKGYLLSYCFNQKKTVGVHQIEIGGKTLIEAVV